MARAYYMSASFDRFHESAMKRTGHSDFGDASYLEGLKVLLNALDEDMRLSELGTRFASEMMVDVLSSRLVTEAGWKQYPEFRDVRIDRPLIITGLPRTGSTALQKLLAMDPQFQGLSLWLSTYPMPRPPRETWPSNPYYQRMKAFLDDKKRIMPAFYVMHDTSIDTPDECMEVLRQSFVCNLFTTFGNSNYQTWWWRQDESASYRRYADVVRLIGLAEPGRRWLLKSPGQHVWGMQWLFDVFPDACVVQTHRDPGKTIPSVCSLSTFRQKMFQENFKSGTKGVPEALKWRQALDRQKPYRKSRQNQIIDILHRDFLRDPMETVYRIYDRFDLTLSGEAESLMRNWIDTQPVEQKTSHKYTAEEFGLTETGIRELFADYIEEFDLVEKKV